MRSLAQQPVHRAGRRVLEAGNVVLPAAGTVGLIGLNGAGKSTLFHALAGTLDLPASRISLDLAAPPVGYAPQQPSFPAWLEVEAVTRLFGFDLAALVSRFPALLLDELSGRGAGELSVGQRQVLSVALALALDAQLTLLDEPFAPLDFRRRIGLVRTLEERRSGPGLTVIASQAAVDLLDTCDWTVVLSGGRYVHSGPTAELAGGGSDPGSARNRFEEAVVGLLVGAHGQG